MFKLTEKWKQCIYCLFGSSYCRHHRGCSILFNNGPLINVLGSRSCLVHSRSSPCDHCRKRPALVTTTFNHGQKSLDTCAFLGRFPIHTGPTPPLTPQTTLDACIQFQLCTGWGKEELQENFERVHSFMREIKLCNEKLSLATTLVSGRERSRERAYSRKRVAWD